jgi:hypothetical protein
MGERQKIEERIRRNEAEVLAFEDKLKTAQVNLSALRDVLKILDSDDERSVSPENKLKAGSSVAMAREIILKQGEAVHVDDLLSEMGRPVNASNRSSLVGSLAAYVRKDDIFTRVAPNTFGLVELGHTAEHNDSVIEEEPPSGFGRAPVATDSWDSTARSASWADSDDDIPF